MPNGHPMTSEKKSGGETGYANNVTQWFFEQKNIADVSSLADKMYEEMHARGWNPETVDWKVVEQGLTRYLASQAKLIVEQLRKSLSNDQH